MHSSRLIDTDASIRATSEDSVNATSGPWPAAITARERQPERDHLPPVANQQQIANQHRVVPGLVIHRREPRDLGELLGSRRHQREFTLLR